MFISRVVRSCASSFPRHRNNSRVVTMNQRWLSTGSDNFDEPSKAKEAETNASSPAEKLLILGGNGFVGSHICQEALNQNLTVSSLSRSGRSSIQDSWANSITWHQADLLSSPDSIKHALDGVTCVISCVGGFGSNSHMYKINGLANIHAIKAAAEEGVQRFVYISAADFGLVNYLLKGYYEGKRSTETELVNEFPNGGVALRPGFIHGTRRVGNLKLPLSIIGAPLEMILKHTKPLSQIPIIGALFLPPVHVTSVARVAVRAAVDPAFPPGILDVYDILHHSPKISA